MNEQQILFEALAKLEKYFGKTLDTEVKAMYVEHLERLPLDKFKAACVRIMADWSPTATKPFPLIADFLAYCGESQETQAVNVVGAVRRAAETLGQYPSVDFRDRALHAAVERYDGWPAIVVNGTDEWWTMHERNFITAYRSAKLAGVNGAAHLAGLHEIENISQKQAIEKPYVVSAITGEVLSVPIPIGEIVKEARRQIGGPSKAPYNRQSVRELLASGVGKGK